MISETHQRAGQLWAAPLSPTRTACIELWFQSCSGSCSYLTVLEKQNLAQRIPHQTANQKSQQINLRIGMRRVISDKNNITFTSVCGSNFISRGPSRSEINSFSASSVRFKLSVGYVSGAKFINVRFMQSLSFQAQPVRSSEWGKAFVSLRFSRLLFLDSTKNIDF